MSQRRNELQRARLLACLWLGLTACGSSSGKGAASDAGRSHVRPDAHLQDAAPSVDAGHDAGVRDAAAVRDAGQPSCAGVVPADCPPIADDVLPVSLRCTGLYADWEMRQVGCDVLPYKPAYELWSDGAQKRRFVALPSAGHIDVSRPDAFIFPVGTQFWKEFSIPDGNGGMRLGETRLLRKIEGGWLRTSYVWNEDASDAVQENDGVADLFGSGHSVPTRRQCVECHQGREDFILGWDLVLLGAGAEGDVLGQLLADGRLELGSSGALPALSLPGSAVEKAALGYLHVNCGVSCHNRSGLADALPSELFLAATATTLTSVQSTDAYTTGINKVPSLNRPPEPPDPAEGAFYDFVPLSTKRSLAVARMQLRGSEAQMPRLGSNKVDEHGVEVVSSWVDAMTLPNGYPAPPSP